MLTDYQREVMDLTDAGHSASDIAKKLNKTTDAIFAARKDAKKKLGRTTHDAVRNYAATTQDPFASKMTLARKISKKYKELEDLQKQVASLKSEIAGMLQ